MTRFLVGFLLVLAGCSNVDVSQYPDAYRQALVANPGVVPPPDAAERFAALYRHVHERGVEERVRGFYAPSLYFNDTLATLTSADQVAAHIARLHEGGTRIDMSIDAILPDGHDLYLRWTMVATFAVLGRSKTSRTIGISHLRFDDTGRAVLQQDFWDPSLGFYRHIPVLGSTLEWVRRRFDPERP